VRRAGERLSARLSRERGGTRIALTATMTSSPKPDNTALRCITSVSAHTDRQLHRDIVVIGASAGGVQALQGLLRALPRDLPAALFVVLHMPPDAAGNTAEMLSRAGPLPVVYPRDGAEITHGRVIVAPPDRHLLVEGSHVRLVRGPRENGVRPAVDALFRSAARSYGPRVVGVLLSGALDDGTAGMLAIERNGGVTMVQDPAEALFPSMPLSALRDLAVDHVGGVDELAHRIVQLAQTRPGEREQALALPEPRENADAELSQGLARPAPFTCPDCGGVLADTSEEGVIRFECYVGHTYGGDSLVAYHSEMLEHALWTALRTLEEAAALRRAMAGRVKLRGLEEIEDAYMRQAVELDARAEVIRAVVVDVSAADATAAARLDPLDARDS
jgi:two-component system chemotaxis response regulator CheB